VSNNLYMPLHPGDYLADAAHLTTIEHGAYFLLILNYWQRGAALASDDRKLARICRLTDAEWAEVKPSLAEFFTEEDGLWKHKRIEAELVKAAEKSEKARASIAKRYASVNQTKNERITNELRSYNDRNTNQDQVQDQEEIKIISAPARSKKGTRLSEDWQPNPDLIETATKLGLSAAHFDREIAKFRDYWASKPGSQGVKLDWDATARNWMRSAAERVNPPPRNAPAQNQTPATAVWINRGSPQWNAWAKARGKEPYVTVRNGDEGAFFRSEWPQAEGVAA
jgi:uncharacterized protein YdaU (DUF1376 family)